MIRLAGAALGHAVAFVARKIFGAILFMLTGVLCDECHEPLGLTIGCTACDELYGDPRGW